MKNNSSPETEIFKSNLGRKKLTEPKKNILRRKKISAPQKKGHVISATPKYSKCAPKCNLFYPIMIYATNYSITCLL
jgi:hypothetical protein